MLHKRLHKHPPHFGNLPVQRDHLAQSGLVTWLRLGKLHVSSLQALGEDIHDFGGDVADVWVLLIK